MSICELASSTCWFFDCSTSSPYLSVFFVYVEEVLEFQYSRHYKAVFRTLANI